MTERIRQDIADVGDDEPCSSSMSTTTPTKTIAPDVLTSLVTLAASSVEDTDATIISNSNSPALSPMNVDAVADWRNRRTRRRSSGMMSPLFHTAHRGSLPSNITIKIVSNDNDNKRPMSPNSTSNSTAPSGNTSNATTENKSRPSRSRSFDFGTASNVFSMSMPTHHEIHPLPSASSSANGDGGEGGGDTLAIRAERELLNTIKQLAQKKNEDHQRKYRSHDNLDILEQLNFALIKLEQREHEIIKTAEIGQELLKRVKYLEAQNLLLDEKLVVVCKDLKKHMRYEAERKEMETELFILNERYKKLKAEKNDATLTLMELQEQLTKMKEQHEEELELSARENRKLHSRIEGFTTEVDALHSRLNELEQEKKKTDQIIESLTRENENLRKKQAEAISSITKELHQKVNKIKGDFGMLKLHSQRVRAVVHSIFDDALKQLKQLRRSSSHAQQQQQQQDKSDDNGVSYSGGGSNSSSSDESECDNNSSSRPQVSRFQQQQQQQRGSSHNNNNNLLVNPKIMKSHHHHHHHHHRIKEIDYEDHYYNRIIGRSMSHVANYLRRRPSIPSLMEEELRSPPGTTSGRAEPVPSATATTTTTTTPQTESAVSQTSGAGEVSALRRSSIATLLPSMFPGGGRSNSIPGATARTTKTDYAIMHPHPHPHPHWHATTAASAAALKREDEIRRKAPGLSIELDVSILFKVALYFIAVEVFVFIVSKTAALYNQHYYYQL